MTSSLVSVLYLKLLVKAIHPVHVPRWKPKLSFLLVPTRRNEKKCIAFHCKFYKIQQKLTAKTFFTKPSSRLLNLLKNRPIWFICPKLLNSLKIAPFVQNCSNCSELLKIVQFQNLLCQNVKWLSPHGFWADTKSAIVRCISLEGIESTRTAGSLMKLVFLELRLDNLQYQLPELVGQGFK